MASENQSINEVLESALEAIVHLRAEGSIVHCITNTVAQNFTANVLLACGATPSMTVNTEEAPYFSKRSDAVLINLGTMDRQRQSAINASLDICVGNKIPFVLDPVKCHVSPMRLNLANQIIEHVPAIIRANEAEAQALKFNTGECKSVIALTGQNDIIHDGQTSITISNGCHWLTKVTAIGCAQGALMAALLSKADSPLIAAIAALLWVEISGENAEANALGPGSFQAAFLDQLHNVSIPDMRVKARLS